MTLRELMDKENFYPALAQKLKTILRVISGLDTSSCRLLKDIRKLSLLYGIKLSDSFSVSCITIGREWSISYGSDRGSVGSESSLFVTVDAASLFSN